MADVRLIDANAAKEKIGFAIEALVCSDADVIRNDALLDAIKIVDSMPTINAQPVKRGKWITTQKTIDDGITTCSYCHREFYIDDLVPVGNADGFCEFCPACGSDNREVSK